MQNFAPVYCDTLVQAREFVIGYLKLDNSKEIIMNDAKRRIVRLSKDIPEWLETTCENRILNWIKSEQTNGRYKYHFVALDRNLVAPFNEYCCWSVISEERMAEMQHQVTQIISDWLHLQCTEWSKKTSDRNKGLKDRLSWSIVHISHVKLVE